MGSTLWLCPGPDIQCAAVAGAALRRLWGPGAPDPRRAQPLLTIPVFLIGKFLVVFLSDVKMSHHYKPPI